MKSKILNILLIVTFFLTIMVPITGIVIHKLASALFLLLCLVHTFMYRKKLNARKYAILLIVIICFVSGLFGMILDEVSIILMLHRAMSILAVFFLAIHVFVYHRKIK